MERNYEEALKCYTNAIRYEKENLQIFRDHTMLQIHLRNFDGYVDANLQLIKMRPAIKSFWLALAVAFFLNKSPQFALETLTHYHDIFQTIVEPNSALENSEVYLFKNHIIEETGDLKQALEHLNKIEKEVLDKRGWKEARARILYKMGELAQAEAAYRALLKINPDSLEYIKALLQCKGFEGELSDEQTVKVLEIFEDLGDEYKKAHAIRRLPLDFAKGERFKVMADNYLKPLFRKGVPSVFVSIRGLYEKKEKKDVVENLLLGYEKNLKSSGRFTEEDDGRKEPPSALLWVYYFLAQHFDYVKEGEKALKYIDEAINHTPTLVELLMTKARILKHHGDSENAMKVMNEARERDLQDRFINTRCTKYMLRNDCVEQAEKTVVLFCRPDSSDKLNDLIELQCMWFAYESGKSFLRQGKLGKALKKFHQIEKHFDDIFDDQFDFHNYSYRRVTLRTYLELLQTEDKLRSHPYFFKAAVEATKIYIRLFDKPKEEELEKENINQSDMTDSEKKKALRKLKKPETQVTQTNGTEKHGAGNPSGKKVDPDPEGQKLLETTEPLKETMKFLKPLLELSPNKIESQILGCAVYLRKKKFLLAFKCLKSAHKIDPENPELFKVAVDFWREFKVESPQLDPKVTAFISAYLADIFGDATDPLDFATRFGKKHAKSVPQAFAVVEVTSQLDRLKKASAITNFVSKVTLDGKDAWSGITHEVLVAIHKSLGSLSSLAAPDGAAKFAAKALKRYPISTYFKQVTA
ncbi:hypothetical protein HDU96_009704 [Phlyctochytrium bullatum]|nr:hypothetical protein HDU96_009704 [Phlyctochytrium bullatum]